MDTPDTPGAEPLAPQTVIEVADGIFRHFRQRDTTNPGEDVAVEQVTVSAHCAAAPPTLVLAKPAVAPLAYGIAVSFLNIVASFWQPNNTTEKRK